MTSEQFIALVEKETKALIETLKKKGSDYSGGESDIFSNFRVTESLGLAKAETGLLIRLVDKIQRVKSFLAKGKLEVDNESEKDAVLDMIGYSFILLAMFEERKQPKQQSEVMYVNECLKHNLSLSKQKEIDLVPAENIPQDFVQEYIKAQKKINLEY